MSRPAAAIRDEIERAVTVGLSVPKAGRSWLCYFLARYVCGQMSGPVDLDLLTGRGELPPIAFLHEHIDVFEDVAAPPRLLNEGLLRRRRLLVLVRDPRDTVVSYWYQKRLRERRPVPDSLELFAACPVYGVERISQSTSLLLDLYEDHPGDRLLVSYEDLVREPVRSLTTVLRFALAGRPLDASRRRKALAASRLRNIRSWERNLSPREARGRYHGRFGPPAGGPLEDGHFKVRQGRVGAFREEMSPELQARVAALPHTATLLDRLGTASR